MTEEENIEEMWDNENRQFLEAEEVGEEIKKRNDLFRKAIKKIDEQAGSLQEEQRQKKGKNEKLLEKKLSDMGNIDLAGRRIIWKEYYKKSEQDNDEHEQKIRNSVLKVVNSFIADTIK